MQELMFSDYSILAGVAAVIITFFLAYVKKPSWRKRSLFAVEGKVDKDLFFIFGGIRGASYFSLLPAGSDYKVYSDGTVDIKLLDGTELKHVNLEKNIKVFPTTGLLSGPIIVACNIDATNRIREWATYDAIMEKVKLSLQMLERVKAQSREEALDLLEVKHKYTRGTPLVGE
ncbi:MAG: hypothetical protein ACTSV7_14940 [Candidatus Baldrarchaeia archaeon]